MSKKSKRAERDVEPEAVVETPSFDPFVAVETFDAPSVEPDPAPHVHVVLADGTSTAATLVSLDDNGLAELTFIHRGQPVTITSAPNDPSGKKPDSWHK